MLLGPHGTAQGKVVYLGYSHSGHLYSADWDSTHEWYSRLCVLYTCIMAYTTGLARRTANNKVEVWAKVARAVVTLSAPFLMIYGLQVTRMAELDKADHTGWALWCIAPFTYLAIH